MSDKKLMGFLKAVWEGVIGNAAYALLIAVPITTAVTWLASRFLNLDPAWAGVALGGLFVVTFWIGLGLILRRLRPATLDDLLASAPPHDPPVWAHVRNLMISADSADPASVTCTGYVLFPGMLDGEEASPTELHLVVPGNDELIARLPVVAMASHGMSNTDVPVMVATYRCAAKDVCVKTLAKAVRAAMQRDPSPPTPAFALVRVREPDGAAMVAHKNSRVRLFASDMLVKVEGWPAQPSPVASAVASAAASAPASP